jgi:hypothetical protein
VLVGKHLDRPIRLEFEAVKRSRQRIEVAAAAMSSIPSR